MLILVSKCKKHAEQVSLICRTANSEGTHSGACGRKRQTLFKNALAAAGVSYSSGNFETVGGKGTVAT